MGSTARLAHQDFIVQVDHLLLCKHAHLDFTQHSVNHLAPNVLKVSHALILLNYPLHALILLILNKDNPNVQVVLQVQFALKAR